MKKNILLLVLAACACYFINWKIGVAASVAVLLVGAYNFMPYYYIGKGNRAYAEDDLDGAISWFKKAATAKRAATSHKLGYALLLMRNGDFDASEKILTAIVRDKTAKAEDRRAAREYRAMNYAKQNRIDEAVEEADEIFAEVKNTVTYGIVGYFAHLTNTPVDETMKLCLEAYEYNSDDRDIADNLVLAYIRAGENEKAAEMADALIENNPKFVEAYYHGAQANMQLGKFEKARELLTHIPQCRRTAMTTVSETEIENLSKELENA